MASQAPDPGTALTNGPGEHQGIQSTQRRSVGSDAFADPVAERLYGQYGPVIAPGRCVLQLAEITRYSGKAFEPAPKIEDVVNLVWR